MFLRRLSVFFRACPLFWVLACQPAQKPATPPLPAPVVVRAGIRVLPMNTLPAPEVLPMGRTRQVAMGTPSVVRLNSRQQTFRPVVVPAGKPIHRMPGQPPYQLPKRVPARPRRVVAGQAKIIVATLPHHKDYNPYNFVNFGLAQGMVESKVHHVFQDRMGNIWLGTYNGVSKYNGKTFETFTKQEGLVDNFLECTYEDRAGNIWLGFREGLTKYDGQQFTNYTVQEGLSDNHITGLLEDKSGQLWITTRGGGVSVLSEDRAWFTHFAEREGLANVVHCVAQDADGCLWFGTADHGLFRYDGRTFTQFTTSQGLTNNTIRSIWADAKGGLWLGTWGGVSRYDGQQFAHVMGLAPGWINSIRADQTGYLWLGALPGGAFRLDNTHQTVVRYTTHEGLADNDVPAVWPDRAGNVWFATFQGVTRTSNLFTTLTKEDGLVGNAVRSFWEDRHHNIWVGALRSGVSRFDSTGQTITNFTPKEGLSDDNVLTMLEDRAGTMWFGYQYGCLNWLSADRTTMTHFLDSGDFVVCVFEDREGNIWYSSRDRGGVFRIDPTRRTRTHFTQQQGLPHKLVVRIYQDRAGHIWFCTFGGIARLDKEGRTMTQYTAKEGMGPGIIESMLEDQAGDLWFGTLGSGLWRLDRQQQYFMQLTETQGLPHNTLFGMLEDQTGTIWIATRTGLSKLAPSVLRYLSATTTRSGGPTPSANRPEPVLFKNYTAENGYLGYADGRYYLLKDRRGTVWIPMLDRLTIYNPGLDRPEPPSIQLTGISLYNEPIIWKKDTSFTLKNGVKVGDFTFSNLSGWYRIPEQLSLPHTNNFINFEFVSVNTNNPQTVRYQYRLEGLDENWRAITNRSEASYGNLSPGTYTFQVRSMNEVGQWSRHTNYTFTIRPPWWETWWAYGLYTLFFVGMIYGIIQYRVAQGLEKIRATESIRVKISSDLHDDVGSILSGLAMQSQMIALTASKDQKDPLNEISDMSHEAMDRMRDTVWAIDSRKDKYENLVDRMRAFAEKNLNLKQISHDFEIAVDDPRQFIDPQTRQNIYLIFKEAISNICKHSDAQQVTIQFRQGKSGLYLLIHDNGSERKPTNSDGLGLKNMAMRATQLGGHLVAHYDNGFAVELVLGKKTWTD